MLQEMFPPVFVYAWTRDVPIPFFPSRYRFRYLCCGYQPMPNTDTDTSVLLGKKWNLFLNRTV